MAGTADNPEETPELERKVDEMMDPKFDAASDAEPEKSVPGTPDAPEIDIFKDAAAPKLDEEQTKNTADISTDIAEPPAGHVAADEHIVSDPSIDDPKTDKLVDDIVSHEGDQILAADDQAIASAFMVETPHRGRIAGFFRGWWQRKWARYGTLVVIVIAAVTAGVFPTSRYFVLNTSGVRVKASITILDQTNNLPLKNVAVTLQAKTVKTDDDGVAHFQSLKLGQSDLAISRIGFAAVHQSVVLGLGSNPLNDVSLRAVGEQFKFSLTNYLSGKPVTNAEVSDGDATAQTDDHGNAVLTIGAGAPSSFQALVTADGYRTENVNVNAPTTAAIPVTMVTSRQVVYVSKQSGNYDVYKSDIDGRNKQVLLAGTGRETPQISLAENPLGQKAALVSRRDTLQNQDGYVLQSLTIINIADGSTLTLEHSEQIQLVGWDGTRLIYVKIKAGTSAGNAQRYQLYSYDTATTVKLLLASANYFSDIVMANSTVYYAASNNFAGGQSQFARIDDDSSDKQILLNADVLNIVRNSYDTLYVSANPSPNWYVYHFGDLHVAKLGSQPADVDTSRFYLDAPDGKHALWTDVRDGKGVLLLYDANTRKDTMLATQAGLTYPLRWLDNRTVMYRISTPQETADYVLSLDGGTSKKVADVTNTAGLGKWFYY